MLGERRDIPEVLVATGALTAPDEDLVACLEETPSALLVADRAGRIAWLNQAMRALLDRSAGECVGRPVVELYADADVFSDMWRSLGAGDVIRGRVARLRTGEGWRDVTLSARPGRDDHGAFAGARFRVRSSPERRAAVLDDDGATTDGGTLTDTTAQAERERLAGIEQALRVSQERLRGLIEVTAQIVWTTDADGRVVEDSPSWRRFTGQTFEEMRGWGWTAAIAPEHRESVRSRWAAAVATERSFNMEYRARRADGSDADLLVRAVPVRDPDGSVREWVGVCVDVSDQRAVEQQREALVADLRRAMHYQDMFIAVLSHDLRSPLSAVLMATSLGLRRCSDERMGRVLQQIASSGRRMLRMIEQLLDVTRIRAAGGLEIRRTRADLALVCRTIIDELQQAHPGARVVLERRGSTIGSWDVDRVSQLASNLIGNALQHAEGARVATVLVDGRDPARVSFVVHNRGAIPPAMLASIFDPFRRAAEGSPRTEGLGLGLYITQQIALAHGGAVSVLSTPARGTSFRVDLPREATPAAEAPAGADDAAPLLRGDAA